VVDAFDAPIFNRSQGNQPNIYKRWQLFLVSRFHVEISAPQLSRMSTKYFPTALLVLVFRTGFVSASSRRSNLVAVGLWLSLAREAREAPLYGTTSAILGSFKARKDCDGVMFDSSAGPNAVVSVDQ
jgi:hypothetical protein